MERYLIAECPRCRELILADSRYKSKTCPMCSSKIRLADLRIIQSARDAREARSKISDAKAKRSHDGPKMI